jgi:hypothetical protein
LYSGPNSARSLAVRFFDVYSQSLTAIASITASAKTAMMAIVNGLISRLPFAGRHCNEYANEQMVWTLEFSCQSRREKYQYATPYRIEAILPLLYTSRADQYTNEQFVSPSK